MNPRYLILKPYPAEVLAVFALLQHRYAAGNTPITTLARQVLNEYYHSVVVRRSMTWYERNRRKTYLLRLPLSVAYAVKQLLFEEQKRGLVSPVSECQWFLDRLDKAMLDAGINF